MRLPVRMNRKQDGFGIMVKATCRGSRGMLLIPVAVAMLLGVITLNAAYRLYSHWHRHYHAYIAQWQGLQAMHYALVIMHNMLEQSGVPRCGRRFDPPVGQGSTLAGLDAEQHQAIEAAGLMRRGSGRYVAGTDILNWQRMQHPLSRLARPLYPDSEILVLEPPLRVEADNVLMISDCLHQQPVRALPAEPLFPRGKPQQRLHVLQHNGFGMPAGSVAGVLVREYLYIGETPRWYRGERVKGLYLMGNHGRHELAAGIRSMVLRYLEHSAQPGPARLVKAHEVSRWDRVQAVQVTLTPQYGGRAVSRFWALKGHLL